MGIRIENVSYINYLDYDDVSYQNEGRKGEVTLIPLPIIDGQRFDSYRADIEAGRIYSTKSGRFLQNKPNENGHVYVCLTSDKGKQKAMGLHVVVMAAYVQVDPSEWIEQGYEVNFADGDRSNCSIFNLVLKSGKKTEDDTEYLIGSSTSRFNVETGDITMNLYDEDDTDGIRLNLDWGDTEDVQGVDTLAELDSIQLQLEEVIEREVLRRKLIDQTIDEHYITLKMLANFD